MNDSHSKDFVILKTWEKFIIFAKKSLRQFKGNDYDNDNYNNLLWNNFEI